MNLLAILVVAIAVIAVGHAHAQSSDYYRVTPESLSCVVQHAETYLAAARETVYINTDACPPSGTPSILDQLRNESPDPTIVSGEALDRFLTLTRRQVECLATLELPGDAKVVRFFPSACKVEVEGSQ